MKTTPQLALFVAPDQQGSEKGGSLARQNGLRPSALHISFATLRTTPIGRQGIDKVTRLPVGRSLGSYRFPSGPLASWSCLPTERRGPSTTSRSSSAVSRRTSPLKARSITDSGSSSSRTSSNGRRKRRFASAPRRLAASLPIGHVTLTVGAEGLGEGARNSKVYSTQGTRAGATGRAE